MDYLMDVILEDDGGVLRGRGLTAWEELEATLGAQPEGIRLVGMCTKDLCQVIIELSYREAFELLLLDREDRVVVWKCALCGRDCRAQVDLYSDCDRAARAGWVDDWAWEDLRHKYSVRQEERYREREQGQSRG